MGDFNVALNIEDVYAGASSLNAAMYEFKDCVSKIEVTDINSSGLHYTWNQKPKGGNGILKKLGRIIGNIDFMDYFLGAYAVFQPYRISDHAPAVLKLPSVTASKPKPFKFFKFLAYESNFLGLVEGKWRTEVGGHNMFQVQKDLNSNPADSILQEEEIVYLQTFNDPKLDEERFLKQKAKVDWIYDISALNMVREVTNKKIKIAMFDIGDDKAPGPDGFTSTFFKKCWHIVGNDVCNAVRDFFNNGCLLKEINNTFLALIPKVSTPLKVNDYRPISCCNVIYKCISKILTNRVIEGIKDVVSDNQSAFIPGRRISDNILVTQELMHNYHNHRGPPRCAFTIDIQKAYDTVDWAFLENILGCFGFPNAMIRWIMACVSSTSFSFCINGNIHGYFKGKRGLRQGDPLSPYLFTMVMEVLTLILKKRVRNSDLFWYHKQCEELEIIMVCFADDLFILLEGRCEFCRQAILNINPFSEGDLPVTYLGVPLISSRLLNRDCKILVEKAKNWIGDWRNKSLLFAGRLQL
ncbi:putative RNA-directed DNA polymerase, eukaryota, reverse transcriptase zinc-binding domain protein, partial [Tanacetum coccineum]